MKRHVVGIGFFVLFAAAHASAAPSAEDTERARTFFNAGAQAYASSKYADAVRSFEQAYALAPRPTVLFSLAQAERKSFLDRGDAVALRRAIEHYKQYIEEVPSGGRHSEALEAKTELEARLARLDPKDTVGPASEKRKPRVTVFSPTPGAEVSIDGGAAAELPYFADLEPGKHRIRVFGDGYFDAEQEISGDRGIDVPVDLPLREKPALVSVELAAAAEVFIDGKLIAETPLARPIEVASGVHVIAIARNGKKSWSQEVVLARAKPFLIKPVLSTSTQRYAAETMIIAGGASLIAGAVFGFVALGDENRAKDLEQKRMRTNLTASELADHNRAIDSRDAARTAFYAFGGAGAAIVLGGALFYVFDRPPVALVPPRSMEPTPRPASPMDVAQLRPYPVVGPGLYGAGLSARF